MPDLDEMNIANYWLNIYNIEKVAREYNDINSNNFKESLTYHNIEDGIRNISNIRSDTNNGTVPTNIILTVNQIINPDDHSVNTEFHVVDNLQYHLGFILKNALTIVSLIFSNIIKY